MDIIKLWKFVGEKIEFIVIEDSFTPTGYCRFIFSSPGHEGANLFILEYSSLTTKIFLDSYEAFIAFTCSGSECKTLIIFK